jgi:hypothetical protein
MVVVLRLDDSQFDRGIAEAIAARAKLDDKMAESDRKQGNSLGNSIGRYLKWAAVFAAIGKTYMAALEISDGLLDLENSSRRLGMSADGLRKWQNAFEMLGGKASDATSEIQKFNQSLNAMSLKGDVDDSLMWVVRATGHSVKRGQTYEQTAPQVFSGIMGQLASGRLKDIPEAVAMAQYARFSGVGEFIAQNGRGATLEQFNAFMASAQARSTPNATSAAGANIGRFAIGQEQDIRQNSEIETAKNQRFIQNVVQGVAGTKQFVTDLMSVTAQGVQVFGDVASGKFNEDVQAGRPAGGWRGSPEMRRRNPPTPNAVPTPNVSSGGTVKQSNTTINQDIKITAPNPEAAGSSVATRTKSAISLSDRSAR